MATSYTRVAVSEFDAADNSSRIVARFADWEDACAVAERWSRGARRDSLRFVVRFNDGFSVATMTYTHGIGEYAERPTRAGAIHAARFHSGA